MRNDKRGRHKSQVFLKFNRRTSALRLFDRSLAFICVDRVAAAKSGGLDRRINYLEIRTPARANFCASGRFYVKDPPSAVKQKIDAPKNQQAKNAPNVPRWKNKTLSAWPMFFCFGLFALYHLQRVRRADVGQTDTRFLRSTRKRGSCVCVGVRRFFSSVQIKATETSPPAGKGGYSLAHRHSWIL